MDLATLDVVKAANLGSVMEVLHPVEKVPLLTDDGTPITITLLGNDSDKVKRRQRMEVDKRLKSGRRTNMTISEIEDQSLRLLAFCTLDWSGIVLDGKPLEFSEENAYEVYKRIPWLKEQVDEFIGDRANFLKDSTK